MARSRQARTHAPRAQTFAAAADTFAMLASPSRLHLLWLLAQGERDVTALAASLSASGPAISQHLAKLRLAGLVSAQRDGKRQVYRVDDPHIVALVMQAVEHHEELAERRPARGGRRWTQ